MRNPQKNHEVRETKLSRKAYLKQLIDKKDNGRVKIITVLLDEASLDWKV